MTATQLHGVLWSDYLCPWCYVGQHRSRMLEAQGVVLTRLPFELHPEFPHEGFELRNRHRYDRIAEVAAEVGMPFVTPTRIPNTKPVLLRAEWVRRHQPEVFPTLDEALFQAAFVEDRFLGDPRVRDEVFAAAGADVDAVNDAYAEGSMETALQEARLAAYDLGIAATPTWVVEGLIIPGLQPVEVFERALAKARARASAGPESDRAV